MSCSSDGDSEAMNPEQGADDEGNGDKDDEAATLAEQLSFTPSNARLSDLIVEIDELPNVIVRDGEDFVVSESSAVSDVDGLAATHSAVAQADGGDIDLYVAESLRIEQGGSLRFSGENPVVVVVVNDIEIDGLLDVGSTSEAVGPGGGRGSTAKFTDGAGEGGGLAADTDSFIGGLGGSFCGLGGAGLAAPTAGEDKSYGEESLVPLVGGSAGGTGNGFPNSPRGHGGGAIQLVSASRISISNTGKVNAGGAGGFPALPIPPEAGIIPSEAIRGSGGGSGGAILLEAPAVQVAGVLAANGGGGGAFGYVSNEAGEDGTASNESALGGAGGGQGSRGMFTEGTPGTPLLQPVLVPGALFTVTIPTAGGGGGGAGRIRINTADGAANFRDGTVSPTFQSGCATEGTLAPRPE